MQQSTAQTNQQDAKKLQELINDIESTKDLVEKEYQQKLNSAQDKIYNIFLLGPSGAGKSTIANELANVRIKFQSDDEETFNCRPDQNLDMMFKISPEAIISETDKPQVVKVFKEFQIIDLPGYFDCRCKYKDLKNIVYSQSLIRISEYSQICIVIPASQFYDYNLEKLIKIMNNIDKNGNDIELTLIISMVNGQKLEWFLKKLQNLLITNKLQTGKELLEKIIYQNRVILFDLPIQDPNEEDVYQFNQEKIRQIKEQIFRQQIFKKYDKIRLNPPDETKITLQGIFEYYHNKIRSPVELLNQQYLRINIQQIICNNDEQQQQIYQESKIYNNLVEDLNKNIQRCHFFTKQFEQTKGQDMKEYKNIKQNIENKIDIFFEDFDIRTNNEYQSAERINDNLYIKCIHLSANQLKQLLLKFSEIKNIFIFALLAFRLDSDLVLPGISLYVSTSYFICQKSLQLQINLKGTDGGQFKPPKAGQSTINPQDGEEGQVGNEGQNGGNLFIDAKVFDIEEENLTINVSGGNGGQGQEGGDGRNGKKGQDAVKINENNRKQHEVLATKELEQSFAENFGTFSNTYERIYQSYGTSGEVGGNSGTGGQGGYGGRAGQVITNKKLYENIISIDGSFGQAGIDGIPGKGGQQGKSFTRIFKCVRAFGALRQHENLQQSQGVGKRVGVNMATFGVATVASVFGTAVKSLMKTQEWLNDGEYNNNNDDIFGENGKVNPRYYTRDDNLKSPEPLKCYEMQEFIKKSKDKLSSNEYMVRIQKETAVIQKNTNQIQTLKFY